MVLLDVIVSLDTPHLVRPADEVDAELRQDVRGVVEGLREVLDPAPDQDVQRPWIVTMGAPDDPVRTLRRCSDARRDRTVDGTLPGDRPQGVGARISGGMCYQMGVVLLVRVEDPQHVGDPSRPIGRRDEPLNVQDVRTEEQMHHRLKVVWVGPSDIGGDEDAEPITARCTALGGKSVGTKTREDQNPDRDGPRGGIHGQIPLRGMRFGPSCLDSVNRNNGFQPIIRARKPPCLP